MTEYENINLIDENENEGQFKKHRRNKKKKKKDDDEEEEEVSLCSPSEESEKKKSLKNNEKKKEKQKPYGDRFEVLPNMLLGKGSFGEIYICADLERSTYCAIKIVKFLKLYLNQ